MIFFKKLAESLTLWFLMAIYRDRMEMRRESLLHWKSLSIFFILPNLDNSSQMNTYHPYSTSYSLIVMNLEIMRSILYD